MSRPRALVTGAGVRLGRATALAVAEAGYDVVLHAHRSRVDAERVAAEISSRGRQAWIEQSDLERPDEVLGLAARVIDAHGRLDLLVNNAGLFDTTPFAEIDRASFDRLHQVNCAAPFFLTQRLLPALLAAPAPVIVNITDVLAERPSAGASHYVMTKAALLAWTKALALELAPRVRVNAVSPGAVLLPEHFSAATRAKVLADVPLAREGTAEDVARAVVFLAGAPYITGTVLTVDGGLAI